MFYLGGVQFSVVAVVLFVGTFIPRGSWSFNPRLSTDDREKDEEIRVEEETRGGAVVVMSVVDLRRTTKGEISDGSV